MSKRVFIFTIVAICSVLYPFVVYFTISEYGIRPLAILLLVVLTLRVLLWQQFTSRDKFLLTALITLLCGLAAWFESETILRYYPVLMNLSFASVFLMSLRSQIPLVERIASLVVEDFPEEAKRYLRGLTLAWGLLLTFNAIVSFYTACCLSLKYWTIYNGVVAYVIFAVFSLAELGYRRFYKKKHIAETGLSD